MHLLLALQELHEHSYIYNNISSKNIFIDITNEQDIILKLKNFMYSF